MADADVAGVGGGGAVPAQAGLLQRLRSRLRGQPAFYRVDRVAPWLLIGPALRDEDYPSLRQFGVTHVVDLRAEHSDDPAFMKSLGYRWRRVTIRDREAPTAEQVDELVRWLDTHPAKDEALYLHCEGGLGRAPTVAMALLIRQRFSVSEAWGMVTTARAEASPTAVQRAWLEDFGGS